MASSVINQTYGVQFPYYNANTDSTVQSNRADAIEYLVSLCNCKGCIASVRYSSGYFYTYIIPRLNALSAGNGTILEISDKGRSPKMAMWTYNGGTLSYSGVLVNTFAS